MHDVKGIRECFAHGINPNDYYKGKPLIDELTSEYLRSPRFKECVKVFVDFGLEFPDRTLIAVLLDDADSLTEQIELRPKAIKDIYTLRASFTPLHEVTLLHICAEFNHVSCAKVLINAGADINACAGVDEHGFGKQTPIFHTVNQIHNASADMLNNLLSLSAELHITVPGLIWGKGYEWETLVPAVNPISYAMMGLLPQMHRNEKKISETVSLLLKAAYGIDYRSGNVPNRYLGER